MVKKVLILGLVLFTSCTKYDWNTGTSAYECGIVIGGETRGANHWLWLEFPDGDFWYKVTAKAYGEYHMLDTFCGKQINW